MKDFLYKLEQPKLSSTCLIDLLLSEKNSLADGPRKIDEEFSFTEMSKKKYSMVKNRSTLVQAELPRVGVEG